MISAQATQFPNSELFSLVAPAVLIVTLIAAYPARRGSCIDPIRALRQDKSCVNGDR